MPAKVTPKPSFAARLLARREELDLTQGQLGAKVGVKYTTISKWENGEREPEELATLVRLAHALHVSVDWLLGVDDAPTPPRPRLPKGLWRELKKLRGGFDAVGQLGAMFPKDDEGET